MINDITVKRLLGEAYINPGYPSKIAINIDVKNNILKYYNAPGIVGDEGIIASSLVSPKAMKMSCEEAAHIAREFVSTLGIDYMDIAITEIGARYYELLDSGDRENVPQCYVFHFVRFVNGIPVTYEEAVRSDAGGMAPSNWYEHLRIDVDDNGVLFLQWNAPTVSINELYENVKMLPFEDIQSIAKQQMVIKNSRNGDSTVTARQIDIDRIELGMVRIAEKNESEEYMLVPAWDFFGYSIDEYSDEIIKRSDFAHSYLTINAIDGSIIDRALGY